MSARLLTGYRPKSGKLPARDAEELDDQIRHANGFLVRSPPRCQEADAAERLIMSALSWCRTPVPSGARPTVPRRLAADRSASPQPVLVRVGTLWANPCVSMLSLLPEPGRWRWWSPGLTSQASLGRGRLSSTATGSEPVRCSRGRDRALALHDRCVTPNGPPI